MKKNLSIVDSHCHLDWHSFSHEQQATIRRASHAGVETMLSINTHIHSFPRLRAMAETYPQVWCSVGIHPCYVEEEGIDEESLFDTLCAHGRHEKVIAFGETGLDYKDTRENARKQKRLLTIHLEAACHCDIPVVIHMREAEEDTIRHIGSFYKNNKTLRGVIHCFSGSRHFAEQALSWGFFISVSGLITYPSCAFLLPIIKDVVPLSRLLLETDSPFLAPPPHRGKRNEPAFIIHTLAKTASCKNISQQELAQATTDNFFTLFTKARTQR
ncbi:MAG: TatD family hydrolase [Alphaproteobacteria bacterium GM7ARS4]|nr:TatD family hydrolase [Alphaproteobacteria bacterium GM7ARS4]